MLKQVYIELLDENNVSQSRIIECWEEIEMNHSEKGRYYHNLNHLTDLLHQLSNVKMVIKDWESILFALFYHDVIYDIAKRNNEDKSAELAVNRMTEFGVSKDQIKLSETIIIATKSHSINDNQDVNIFTDADLSILGRDFQEYSRYSANIRKEYSIYPNFMYNRGRKKVVKHFLSMPSIYKTEHFRSQFEEKARQNLQKELKLL